MSIEYLDLTVLTYNSLKRAGYNTISEVETATDEELLAVPHFKEKSLLEVRTKIDEYKKSIPSVENEHICGCKYCDNAPLYAYMMLGDNKILIAASEVQFFEDVMEDMSLIKTIDENVDFDMSDNEPFQIVYGAVMMPDQVTMEEMQFVEKFKEYALVEIGEEHQIISSSYEDIELYPELRDDKRIPFAALMKLPYQIEEEAVTSHTFYPYIGDFGVVDSMLNRSFLLSCRRSESFQGKEISTWREHIDCERLRDAFYNADIYTGEE